MKQIKETIYPIVILALSVMLAYYYGMNHAHVSLIKEMDCNKKYQDSVIIKLLHSK
jgi:hypothetical protein